MRKRLTFTMRSMIDTPLWVFQLPHNHFHLVCVFRNVYAFRHCLSVGVLEGVLVIKKMCQILFWHIFFVCFKCYGLFIFCVLRSPCTCFVLLSVCINCLCSAIRKQVFHCPRLIAILHKFLSFGRVNEFPLRLLNRNFALSLNKIGYGSA